MRFRFNEKKATQAAACLLERHRGRMNYMALIKLLYLADRASLLECGAPITGDRMVSMPHGPVLSMMLDCVNAGDEMPNSSWASAISPPQGYEVELLTDPGRDELSVFEVGLIEGIDHSYGHLTQWQLRELTHALPEYRDPEGSSLPIAPEEILRAEGKSPEQIEQMSRGAEELWFIDRMVEGAQ